MRLDNIKVSFKSKLPINEPDGNGLCIHEKQS